MAGSVQHCSFVLLADFDIDRGAQLTYQFPQPLGCDEGLLANLMLPDGAEKQMQDWTTFFLNQTPFSTIAPVLALDSSEGEQPDSGKSEMLYVLNLVRTKLDPTARRGAHVKAMAICTRHPFLNVYKPLLLLALEDYFNNPSQECLARVFDCANAMDISEVPVLTRWEKLIMRTSERSDIFSDKIENPSQGPNDPATATQQTYLQGAAVSSRQHRATGSVSSQESHDEGILMHKAEQRKEPSRPAPHQPSPSEASFSLDGSAVWVGDESGLEQAGPAGAVTGAAASTTSVTNGGPFRGRRSTDAASSISTSSNGLHIRQLPGAAVSTAAVAPKDSRIYTAYIHYSNAQLPIKIPLANFPEEVGDYSFIELLNHFKDVTLSGPLHPHLHTNGMLTPPAIVLFNALLTGKRIIFLGYGQPAHLVCKFVLTACAMATGCGVILRGFIHRAFPYANLTNRDEWEAVPGYIAGVTNPIFETLGSWDLLYDIGTKRMVVSKDIHQNHPVAAGGSFGQLITRTGTLRAEGSIGSEEDSGRQSRDSAPPQKGDFAAKPDHPDNVFIDDLVSLIGSHLGEPHVQARFLDYLLRFIRLASKYEEDTTGTTTISFPNLPYVEKPNGERRLGSGITLPDDTSAAREVAMAASRIEAWRRTESYRLYQQDAKRSIAESPIHGFDLMYQLWRLRQAKKMANGEAELIMRTLAHNLQTYDQVTHLLAYLPPHHQGLLPLSWGLFHQLESVRDSTVDIFNALRAYPIGVQFLQSLNHFQRYAYVKQAHAKEARLLRDQNVLTLPANSLISRTPSNRSETSIAAA